MRHQAGRFDLERAQPDRYFRRNLEPRNTALGPRRGWWRWGGRGEQGSRPRNPRSLLTLLMRHLRQSLPSMAIPANRTRFWSCGAYFQAECCRFDPGHPLRINTALGSGRGRFFVGVLGVGILGSAAAAGSLDRWVSMVWTIQTGDVSPIVRNEHRRFGSE